MSSKHILLDTHIFLWFLSGSKRFHSLNYLKKYSLYWISPISILEIRFLEECGRIKVDLNKILEKIRSDERLKIDDISLESLCIEALDISWTRDPFDRLLVAHSSLQKVSLATCDDLIQKNYPRAVF